MTNSPAAPLAELSIILPFTPRPAANYAPSVIDGDHLYRSGQGPRETDGTLRTGKVGTEASIDQARDDVHLRGVNPLAATQEALSDLGGVRTPFLISSTIPRVSTDIPICLSKCSAKREDTRGQPWAQALCRTTSRPRSKPSRRFAIERPAERGATPRSHRLGHDKLQVMAHGRGR